MSIHAYDHGLVVGAKVRFHFILKKNGKFSMNIPSYSIMELKLIVEIGQAVYQVPAA